MLLSCLLQGYYFYQIQTDCDISQLALDSRQIIPHALFVALHGTHENGSKYIPDAISKGAAAILIEAETENAAITQQHNVPIIPIYQLKNKLGQIASRFYEEPAKKLRMIGVTGTNGKTSCTHFIAQILQSLHQPCGLIGTLGSGFYGSLSEMGLTTPDAITLQATLQHLLKQDAKAIAMEVSSHSLDQGRVNDIPFEIGIFTNLTQDHLDYHGDMAAYAKVKQRFFAEWPIKHLILNADDSYGAAWIHQLAQQKSVFAYSIRKPAFSDIPAIYTKRLLLGSTEIKALVASPFGECNITVPLIGQFNLSNALAVLTALCLYGIPFKEACYALSQLEPVPGRMQILGGGKKPLVVVDYAHTPDALEKVLQALRDHTNGKLICVFGCGGDRDQTKRPEMAKIAEELADQVIVTNDNPRHEKQEEIAKQIMQGFTHPERVSILLDRSKAIKDSIQLASPGDCVLIAGKGAERYQQIGNEKIPFDDVEWVKQFLDL